MFPMKMNTILLSYPSVPGLCQAPGRRYLEVQGLREDGGGWCVDRYHNGGRDSSEVRLVASSYVLLGLLSCLFPTPVLFVGCAS